jgi:hypothetical protein
MRVFTAEQLKNTFPAPMGNFRIVKLTELTTRKQQEKAVFLGVLLSCQVDSFVGHTKIGEATLHHAN